MSIRPRLLDDVRFVRCEEGVYLHGGRGSCVLTGVHMYDWIERLARLLTGERSLTEITGGIPEKHRAMVESLVDVLRQHRLVVDARSDRDHGLTADECSEYAAEVAFIRYSADSAEWRFEQLRNAEILLFGSGPAAAVVEAGLRSGWRRLRIHSDDPSIPEVVATARRDRDQQVRYDSAGSALVDAVDDADLVVAIASDTVELAGIARACAAREVALIEVLVREADAWLTPVLLDTDGRARVESAWQRLATAERGPSPWLAGAVPAMIAASVALVCFRHLTGMVPERAGQPYGETVSRALTRVDLLRLDSTVHRLPHRPEVPPSGPEQVRKLIRAMRGSRQTPTGELLARIRRTVDPHVGLLVSLDEGDLPQVPFALCRATVPRMRAPGSAESVLGWGADRETAHAEAALSASAAVAGAELERRRRAGADIWALELVSGTVRAVPCDARRRIATAATTWEGALRAALLAHCEELLDTGEPLAESATDGNVEVGDAVRLLDRIGPAFAFREHGEEIGLPACTVSVEGEIVARSVAGSFAQAVRSAAERALLFWQTGIPNWPASAVAADTMTSATADLVRAVEQATGLTALAVPMSHDPVLGTVAVQVVLCDA